LKFPDKFFDYVTCLGALEHFLDMSKGVSKMVRVGKDNALFCIVVPNINYLFWKIRKIKGTEQQDINENLLSLKQWKDFFIHEELEILKIYQDRWFTKSMNIFSSNNPFGVIKRIMYKFVWVFIPLNYTYQFIFVLRKK